MSSSTLTERGQRTRERLLDAARDLIVAGDGDCAFADVAARAEVSAGAPYRYFPSKSALLVAVVERFFDALEAEAYRPRFEDAAGSWWQGERMRISRYIEVFHTDPLGALVVRGLASDPEVARTVRQRLDKQSRGAARNIRRGQTLGYVAPGLDPALTGALLMGGIYQALAVGLAETRPDRERWLTKEIEGFMAKVVELREDEKWNEAKSSSSST
ncbi:MAG: TetR/AcrR family transcriptional regulator [Myxococcota bacterium]